eukprot:1023865-Pelagomonas_calceolata.AAC.2
MGIYTAPSKAQTGREWRERERLCTPNSWLRVEGFPGKPASWGLTEQSRHPWGSKAAHSRPLRSWGLEAAHSWRIHSWGLEAIIGCKEERGGSRLRCGADEEADRRGQIGQ